MEYDRIAQLQIEAADLERQAVLLYADLNRPEALCEKAGFLGVLLAVTLCILCMAGLFIVGFSWPWLTVIAAGLALFVIDLKIQASSGRQKASFDEVVETLKETRMNLQQEMTSQRMMSTVNERKTTDL